MTIAFGGTGVEPELTRIINAAYEAGEQDIWQPGWQRVSVERMRELVAAGEIVVAGDGETPVGCMRLQRLDDDAAMFGMLSVDPAAHGTGLGKALVAFAEHAFDVSEMELELLIPRGAPHPKKVRLHEWYSRLGYRQIGRRPFDEPELIRPADLFVYRKSLRAVPATDAPPRAET
ncbi:GNAT family N-acetyltransferase [Solirubrobacter taibaiensis]|nr:GNAT family N-acetyltransferase [Solirubrobacter taibaiensis]